MQEDVIQDRCDLLADPEEDERGDDLEGGAGEGVGQRGGEAGEDRHCEFFVCLGRLRADEEEQARPPKVRCKPYLPDLTDPNLSLELGRDR